MNQILTAVSLSAMAFASANGAIIWNAGKADNAQEFNFGNRASNPGGGGPNAEQTRENGLFDTGLPGNPANVGGANGDVNRDVDDDYYFAGNYVTTVGNAYTGVGIVAENEAAMERAWTAADNVLRFHFNLAGAAAVSDQLKVGFGVTNGFHNPDDGATSWNINIAMNGVSLSDHTVTSADGNGDWVTPAFSVADVGGAAILGADFDNYVTLTATRTAGGGNWVSLDYAEMDVSPIPEPSSTGLALLSIAGLGFIRRRK
ncbi:PEP-CTERM sorting domain-containing protein [bacterium]|nr:PEP-CTERM sorting domain-containing protein [bacterium]